MAFKEFTDVSQKYRDWEVEKLRVVRRPLPSAISSVGRLVGDFGSFDELFHLYVETSLRDPLTGERTVVMTERNQTLKALDKQSGGVSSSADSAIDLTHRLGERPSTLTYGEMIENARIRHKTEDVGKGKDFATYDVRTNNCQIFVSNLLKANGLYQESDGEFIDQHAEKLLPKWAGNFANKATGMAAYFSNWRQGMRGSADEAVVRRNPRLRFHNHYTAPDWEIPVVATNVGDEGGGEVSGGFPEVF